MKRLFFVVGLGLLGLILALIPLRQIHPRGIPGASAQGNQQQITVLSSASRTAATNSSDLLNGLNVKGAYVILNVTGAMTTPLITPSIQAIDPTSGSYVNLLVASTGVSTIGTYTYLLYTGAVTGASVTQISSLPLPNAWRVSVAVMDTDPITYSIGALLIQ